MSGDVPGAAGGHLASLAPGSRIAGYRLEAQIGRGGMAVVYRARDERLGRQVALKILAPALAGDLEFQRRFVSESRAAAAIDDPHIVPVFEAGQADGALFIAMRYVAGGDAHSLLQQGPLPPGRVAEIISAVASALDAAHRAGLVHRDVKPSNMLMDMLPGRPDHVYLADFGLSKATAATSGWTRVGEVMGTLEYMSPEQVSGRPADARADQYALACSAFELLAGTPPFRRDNSTALMYAHLSEPPPRLTSLRPALPRPVDNVLSAGLAKAPGDRYASCGQFADALRQALGFQPYDSAPRAMPPRPPAEAAWPAGAWPAGARDTAAATQTSIPARPAAPGPFPAAPGPFPAAPSPFPAGAGPFPAGAGGGQAQPPPRRPRRRMAVMAGAAAVVLAAAGLTAGLLAGGGGKPVPVPISAKSQVPALTGDVYVIYHQGKDANAEVYGKLTKVSDGEVAQLYAQPFPYENPPAQVGSVILHPAGGAASYQFQVTPSLATRYQVELFQSSAASAPLGTSATATIYVALSGPQVTVQKCGRPVCHETLQTDLFVPPSALRAEMSKTWYPYFGIDLSAGNAAPPAPKFLLLNAGDAHVSASHRISADEFGETLTLSFQIGNDAYYWDWNTCSKDTVTEDGIGLPGHHGCGDPRIPDAAPYLG